MMYILDTIKEAVSILFYLFMLIFWMIIIGITFHGIITGANITTLAIIVVIVFGVPLSGFSFFGLIHAIISSGQVIEEKKAG